ncbi:MAG: hypothetical protein A2Z17_04715 [Gammaproteobacteria bacterium RBG_16_66_13]|nr:MAG: hypothetical protein A2Z17_04715 [Gammaproteobacteria bacterium RBG_16_66_13]
MAILLLLFLGGLALFLLLYRLNTAVPRVRVPLPQAPFVSENRPAFEGVLEGVRRPLSVAVSPDGQRIYVAEGWGERAVRILDASGRELGTIAPPATDVFDRQPTAVAVTPDGTVFVVERILRRVLKYDGNGKFLGELMPPVDEDWAPLGIGVDASGKLYVAEALDLPDRARHRILVFESTGQLVSVFGSKEDDPAGLSFPHDVAVDAQGRVYVATIDAVKVFDENGQFLFALGGGGEVMPGIPWGVAVHDDRLYVVDLTNHRLLGYDISGERPTSSFAIGGYGTELGALRFPQGIAVSATGKLFIADRDNDRIAVWAH